MARLDSITGGSATRRRRRQRRLQLSVDGVGSSKVGVSGFELSHALL
jgi:hypothetical protein